ncbi:uncharacterized protein LOC143236430 isoform X1 [Tachypleus tridentatus]|uniref:uncharacterized protein LOC143236430 isoform X1 n=2 Tax=Tachypleus tridentatus TaxID=6853 RepID=UPI003FD1D1BF
MEQILITEINPDLADMTQTASCGRCKVRLFTQILDGTLLLLVLVVQGSMLNYLLILNNQGSAGWYFWFLADFLILIMFMAAVVAAYRFNAKMDKLRHSTNGQDESLQTLQPFGWIGMLPSCYMVWILYSSLLITKVILLLKLEIAQRLEMSSQFSPQLLKLLLAASAVVFLLLVESHHGSVSHSARQYYISLLSTNTTFEIFDSVTFLGILFTNQSQLVLPLAMSNGILVLSSINFILPTLALYKLSLSAFGLKPASLGLGLFYKFAYLFLINLPYLGIRVYLWTSFDHDISLFLMKNIIAVVILLRLSIPDIVLWWQLLQENFQKQDSGRGISLELEVIYRKPED